MNVNGQELFKVVEVMEGNEPTNIKSIAHKKTTNTPSNVSKIETGRFDYPYDYDYKLEFGGDNIINTKILPLSDQLPPFYGYCYYCDYARHSQNYCPLKLCHCCGKYGHSIKVCPKYKNCINEESVPEKNWRNKTNKPPRLLWAHIPKTFESWNYGRKYKYKNRTPITPLLTTPSQKKKLSNLSTICNIDKEGKNEKLFTVVPTSTLTSSPAPPAPPLTLNNTNIARDSILSNDTIPQDTFRLHPSSFDNYPHHHYAHYHNNFSKQYRRFHHNYDHNHNHNYQYHYNPANYATCYTYNQRHNYRNISFYDNYSTQHHSYIPKYNSKHNHLNKDWHNTDSFKMCTPLTPLSSPPEPPTSPELPTSAPPTPEPPTLEPTSPEPPTPEPPTLEPTSPEPPTPELLTSAPPTPKPPTSPEPPTPEPPPPPTPPPLSLK